jgi:L-aminopeptidase/D-esterase-like protein
MTHGICTAVLVTALWCVFGLRRADRAAAAANETLTAVPGVKVGHHTMTLRPTGCTVVLVEAGATAGVDVRGAAPATRDTALLRPEKMVQQIYGVSLSGGSLYAIFRGAGRH